MSDNVEEKENWSNGEERREAKRRYTSDRRAWERKKYYLGKILIPIVASVMFAGLISWGAYVTHTTYTISANYEQTFTKALESQMRRELTVDHDMEMMKEDYNTKFFNLRKELTDGMRETREALAKIYKLLLLQEQERRIRESKEWEEKGKE